MDDIRFSRQVRFAPFGAAGQAAVEKTRAAVVGLGGLGSWIAEHLVRAGAGTVVLVDRDVVEESNLPRQGLYSAADARAGLPKAEAAAVHLAAIGGPTRLEPHVRDLSLRTIDGLLDGCEIVLDGLDNFAGRYLLNDWCRRRRLPWVYGGAVGGSGTVLLIGPDGAPCLRCLFPDADGSLGTETCETVGVFSPLPALIAALQAGEALRWIAGDRRAGRLHHVDPWEGRLVTLKPGAAAADCPCCAQGRFPALEATATEEPARLCGRDAVQLFPPRELRLALDEVARRWQGLGAVEQGRFFARLRTDGVTLTLFDDGRALVQGTASLARARSLYDRYVGS